MKVQLGIRNMSRHAQPTPLHVFTEAKNGRGTFPKSGRKPGFFRPISFRNLKFWTCRVLLLPDLVTQPRDVSVEAAMNNR